MLNELRVPAALFPIIASNDFELINFLSGNTELSEVLSKLWKAVDDAEMQKNQDIREEVSFISKLFLPNTVKSSLRL